MNMLPHKWKTTKWRFCITSSRKVIVHTCTYQWYAFYNITCQQWYGQHDCSLNNRNRGDIGIDAHSYMVMIAVPYSSKKNRGTRYFLIMRNYAYAFKWIRFYSRSCKGTSWASDLNRSKHLVTLHDHETTIWALSSAIISLSTVLI